MSNGLYSYYITRFHQFYAQNSLLRATFPFFFSAKSNASSDLPKLKNVDHIASNITRVLGLNPGPHTLQGTNTYLIGSSASKILVDTGEGKTSKEYVALLLDQVFSETKTTNLSHILITHGHGDHQGGLQEIVSGLEKRKMTPLPTIHKYQSPTGRFPVKNFDTYNIKDGETFETTGASLQAVYSPGHTDDHMCFILKENNALLSGDCILGCGTAVFEELHSYMNSLKKLRQIMIAGYSWRHVDDALNAMGEKTEVVPITAIYPGHGLILSSSVIQKVDEYIAHREEREHQILSYLQACHSVRGESSSMSWRSSWEVMSAIYPSSLHVLVKLSAQHNVQHHLSKLETDGVVSSRWPDLWCYRDHYSK